MLAKIYRIGINYYIEYFEEDGTKREYGSEWIKGLFSKNPLEEAKDRAKFWGCKVIQVID